MKKIGFYLLGAKGLHCLEVFLTKYTSEAVKFVVIGTDCNVENDFSCELEQLCKKFSLNYSFRNENIKTEADYYFAIGWRWMLPNEKLIVFHDSILPKYRGFSPLVNMLINGEKTIGVTCLFASSEYDCGDILAQETKDIVYPITINEAIEQISVIYANLMIKVTEALMTNTNVVGSPQDDSEATYSIWRDENDYQIDWTRCSKEIERFVNAVGYPFKGAKSYVNEDKVIEVLRVRLIKDVVVENRQANIGKVIFMNGGLPTVICGDGLVELVEYKVPQGAHISFRTRFKYR